MKNVKHLLAGFVVGIVMAIAPSCGTAKNCNTTDPEMAHAESLQPSSEL